MSGKFSWKKRMIGEFVFQAKRTINGRREIEQLARVYVAAFNIFSFTTPCAQAYSKKEIKKVLADRDMIKFVIYYEKVAIGLGLATTNLKKVPWINFRFYQQQFRSYAESQSLYYFKGLAIMPEFQDTVIRGDDNKEAKIAVELCRFMAGAIPEGCIVAFDCSEKMTPWLTDAILSSTGCFCFPKEANGRSFVDKQVYTTIHKVSTKKREEK